MEKNDRRANPPENKIQIPLVTPRQYSLMCKEQLIHDQFDYSEQVHEQYLRDGYLFFDHFLTEWGLAHCREMVDNMIAQLPEGSKPEEMMISSHQCGQRWLFDLATESKLLGMVERQIGPNILLWSSHLLCKPPKTGVDVPWHQDAPYWNITGPHAAGIWIPLDDLLDADIGTMSVLPGWHNRGVIPTATQDDKLFPGRIDLDNLPEDLQSQQVIYHLHAGQLAIHDTMLPHSSLPNRSDRWRRVIGLRYVSAEIDLAYKEYPNFRTGEMFEREFFLVRGNDVRGHGLRRSPF